MHALLVACTLTKNRAIITLRCKRVTLPTLLNKENEYLMGNNNYNNNKHLKIIQKF